MHKLLERQLKRHFGDAESVPAELSDFTAAIDAAYHQADADRELLERSLDLTSDELLEVNAELRLDRRELELRVADRTTELLAANRKLEREITERHTAELRLRASEGGYRVAVIADAEWLNIEAQNALLRLLEEPPDKTTLLLLATTSTALLPTVRSRCQRLTFPSTDPPLSLDPDAPQELRTLLERLEGIGRASTPDLLDWAEQFRGARASAVQNLE